MEKEGTKFYANCIFTLHSEIRCRGIPVNSFNYCTNIDIFYRETEVNKQFIKYQAESEKKLHALNNL